MYPRDMVEQRCLEPQQRALFKQKQVTLLGNDVTVKQTQWLFPPPNKLPPLAFGSHYFNREPFDPPPPTQNIAFTPSFPHVPPISRNSSITPIRWHSY